MSRIDSAIPRRIEVQVRHHAAEALGLADADTRPLVMQLLEAPVVEIFKNDGRSRLTLHRINDALWVVKRFYASDFKTRLKQWVHQSPAWREWNGALQLHQAKARVLEPIALITGPIEERCREAIVMPLGGQALSHWLAADGPVDQWTAEHRRIRQAMAQKIGEQFGDLLSHGVVNRDHKAANLLVDAACSEGEQPPQMIDPAGLRQFRDPYQALRALRLLHKTATGSGYVRPTEILRVLRGLVATHPDLEPAGPQRLRRLARRVLAIGEV
jgi:hypothetical protein